MSSLVFNKYKTNAGFTLLEIIMGSMILAIIGTLCYGALWSTFKTQKTIDSKSDIQELGTAVINKIRIDLAQTFHVETPRPLTRFKAEDNGSLDKVSFTALVHIPTEEDAHESDQALVTYQTIPSAGGSGLNILQRRETPIIAPKDDAELAQADFVDITNNLVQFNLEYFDGEKYQVSWDIESPAQKNKLPTLIKISIVLKDEREIEHTFFNTVDLPMWQNLSLDPQQKPAAAGNAQQNGQTPTPGVD